MLLEFLIYAVLLVGATIVIHTVGTTLLVKWLERREQRLARRPSWFSRSVTLVVTGMSLMFMHLMEMSVWALAYWGRENVPEFDRYIDALYFSAATYTTLGYGDIVIDQKDKFWRLMCGLEAINGILLAGWSTALLFLVVHALWQFDERTRRAG